MIDFDFDPRTRVRALAIHEAAHAVIGTAIGFQVQSVTIGTNASDGGQCTYETKTDASPESQIIRAVSGAVAQSRYEKVPFQTEIETADAHNIRNVLARHMYHNCFSMYSNPLYLGALRKTKAMVWDRSTWSAIKAVAKLLIEHRELSGADIASVLRQHEIRGAA